MLDEVRNESLGYVVINQHIVELGISNYSFREFPDCLRHLTHLKKLIFRCNKLEKSL